jgi:hypothetical protein
MSGMNDIMRFLDHVDMRTLNAVAEKLKKSRNKKEQAVGAFLARVYAYRIDTSVIRESEPQAEASKLFDGLRDIT